MEQQHREISGELAKTRSSLFEHQTKVKALSRDNISYNEPQIPVREAPVVRFWMDIDEISPKKKAKRNFE
jgi:hypothetical protein